MNRWPYFNGMRAQTGASPLRLAPVGEALAIVQHHRERGMDAEQREEWEGWMTCTWRQAVAFLRSQGEEELEGRLAAARMMGAM